MLCKWVFVASNTLSCDTASGLVDKGISHGVSGAMRPFGIYLPRKDTFSQLTQSTP